MDLPVARLSSDESGNEIDALRRQVAELEQALQTTRSELAQHADAEQRFRDLIELLPDAVYLHQDGKVAYINQAGLKLLGAASREVVVGRSTFDFIDPERRDEIRERHRRMIEDGEHFPMLEQKRLRIDGTSVYVEAAPIPYTWNGRPAVLVVNRDITERKNAERALRASEEFRARLINFMPDAVSIQIDRRIVFVNPAAVRLFGADNAEQIIGQSNLEFIHPDSQNLVLTRAREVTECGTATDFVEQRRLRLDGTDFPAEVAAVPVMWEGAQAVMVVLRDVTERHRNEKELERKTALLETTLDNMGEGLWVFDSECRLVTWNQRLFELLDFPPEMARAGVKFEEFIRIGVERGDYGPGDPDKIMAEKMSVANGQVPCTLERGKPGGKAFEIRHNPMPAGGFVSTYLDITARKNAERALAENSALLQTTFDHMSQGISVYDADLRLVSFNQKFVELFRFPPGFIRTGLSYEDIVRSMAEMGHYGPGDIESLVQRRIETARSGEIRRLERTAPDGTTHAVWRNPLPDGGFVTTFTDITERRRAEHATEELNVKLLNLTEELTRSNEDLEQFAYVASHDLQEPLRMVSSYCQLLQKRFSDKLDSDGNEFIEFAVEGAGRMQRLINDLLKYSRVGTSGKPLQPTPCNEVVAEAISNLSVAIEEAGAEIIVADLPTVNGDPVQLAQLFQNLIGNAIKFRSEQPCRIRIEAEHDGDERIFSVSDNGIGIEMNFADRIFLIFQRLHNRTEYPGTGIGLAVCKKIVMRHGGQLKVASQPGAGCTFSFNLPATEI